MQFDKKFFWCLIKKINSKKWRKEKYLILIEETDIQSGSRYHRH